MQFTTDFKDALEHHYERLSKLTLELIYKKPAPNKWSPIEILGHLVDSACNNHRRFTIAQWQENMVFDGYQQNNWVQYQQYQQADWQHLLGFWRLYNLHICRIMENTPLEKLKNEVKEHNLHQIAMVTVPKDQSVTLEYFMKDYIFHIEHHMKQIYYLSA